MKKINLLLTIVILLPSLLLAQVPQTLNFQGVLTDPITGQPIADGDYTFDFEIFDDATVGVSLWTEIQALTTTDGLYNAVLGAVAPLNIAFDKPYWLEITITKDATTETLSPRIEITSPAYMLNDNIEDLADGTLSDSKLETTINRTAFTATGNVTAGGSFSYSSAKTRYLTVSHAAFVIGETSSAVRAYRDYTDPAPYILYAAGGTTGNTTYFIASVNLPNGAIVTNLSAGFYDTNLTYNGKVRLVRQRYDYAPPATMAEVVTTGSGGQSTLNTSTVSNGTINNFTYGYNLVFETTENNTSVGFYGVRITYTVTTADQ